MNVGETDMSSELSPTVGGAGAVSDVVDMLVDISALLALLEGRQISAESQALAELDTHDWR